MRGLVGVKNANDHSCIHLNVPWPPFLFASTAPGWGADRADAELCMALSGPAKGGLDPFLNF